MQHSYNPDTQPFELALSNLGPLATPVIRGSLVDVSDTIDFAKRILLQHKVKNFTAHDVVEVARMIMQRRRDLEQKQREADHGPF